MSSNIVHARRRSFTRLAFVLCIISITSIAGLAAFGPQSMTLRGLLTPFIGAAAPKGNVEISFTEEAAHIEPAALATTSGTLSVARSGHTATLLSDGRVLVVGGSGDTTAELFDPASSSSVSTGNTVKPRTGHTATRLADGRVLIAGGSGDASTEIYDPANGGTFALGPDMSVARTGHTAAALSNGNVLIAGGGSDSAEIFDGTAFAAAGTMSATRTNASSVTMSDGRVLIAGGDGLNTAEIYTPGSGFAPVGNAMTLARSRALLRVLPDGKVQIIGGNADGSMEVYDPAIDTIGAYSHVIPVGDPCAGLITQVLRAETRSALIYSGAGSSDRDRSNFSVTELGNGEALVIGGTSAGGSALNAVTVFQSSGATVTTDKLDYAPGETANISGTGFAPGETVRVMIHEDPHTPQERGFDATADASGNFTGTYLVQDYDLNMKFVLGARGLTSGETAQTTFTDSTAFTITVSPTSVAPSSTTTFVFTFTSSNAANTGGTTTDLTVPAGWTTPQSGIGPGAVTVTAGSCNVTLNTIAGMVIRINQPGNGCNNNQTFTVTYSSSTAPPTPGSYQFISNHGTGPSVTVTGNATTATSVVSSANPSTFGDNVTFTASVKVGTTAVTSGSVTFIEGGTCAAPGTTLAGPTALNGSGQAAFSKANFSVASHAVFACYGGASGFNSSNGSVAQTVNKKTLTASIIGNPTKPYDGNTNATLAPANFSLSGLVGTDNFSVTKTTGTYDSANAGPRTVSTTLATGDLTPAGGTLAANYTLPTTASGTGTIGTADQTITFGALANKTYGDGDFSVSATASSNLTVSFAATGACTVTGTNVHITGAGSCTITASQAGDANYNAATPVPQTVSIGKKSLIVTPDPQSITYGAAEPAFTFQYSGGFVSPDTAGGIDTPPTCGVAGPHTNVGSYTIACSGGLDNNYSFDVTVTATFTVGKANATVVVVPYHVTYDGNDHTASVTSVTGVNGETGATVGAVTVTGTTHTNAGTYNDTWSFTGTTNYNDQLNVAITNQIDQANVTAKAGSGNGTYNGSVQSPANCAVTGDFIGSLTCTNSPVSVGPGIGTFEVTPVAAGPDLANFNVTSENGEYSIDPAIVTSTAGSGSGTYNGSTQSPSACVVSGDYIGSLTCANSPASVGPGFGTTTIAPITSGSDIGNFLVQPVNGSYTISKALVTATAGSGSGQYTGLAQSTGSCVVSGAYTGGLSCTNNPATAGPNAGTTITGPVTSGADIANFIVTDAAGSYTITQAPSETIVSCPASVVFNGAAQTPCTVSVSGAGGLNLSPTPDYANNVNVGTATASYTFPGDANHSGSSDSATFAIGKYAFNVCDSDGHCVGGSDPNGDNRGGRLTFSQDAAFGGPATAEVTLSPASLGTTDSLASPGPGPMPIEFRVYVAPAANPLAPVFFGIGTATKVDGDTAWHTSITENLDTSLVPGNYVAYVYGDDGATLTNNAVAADAGYEAAVTESFIYPTLTATFTVSKAEPNCTVTPYNVIYDGLPHTAAGTCTGIGGSSEVLTGLDLSGTTHTDAGDYTTDPWSFTDVTGNYNDASGTVHDHIDQRIASWTTNPSGKTYGDADPTPLTTGSGTNFVASDNVTATYSRLAGENAGSYHITATLASTGSLTNYNITNEGADFTIIKRLATWTTNPASKTYGDADPAGLTTGSGSNFVVADNVTATYTRSAGENASPPTYHITATLSAAPGILDNYTIMNDGAEFTINKRAATWTTNPNSKTYGEADPATLTTGSGSNFVEADNVTATYSRVAGEEASLPTYHISATLATTGSLNNYIITNTGAEFTINKRDLTVTASSHTVSYASPVPTITPGYATFVSGDDAADLDAAPTCGTTYTTSSGAGTLQTTSCSGGSDDNYNFVFVGGTVTVEKANAVIVVTPYHVTYDGIAHTAVVTSITGVNSETGNAVGNVDVSGTTHTNVETYNDTWSFTGTANYNDQLNVAITNQIDKRAATWTTQPNSKTYGDAEPNPLTTGSGTNFVVADGITATYSRNTGETANVYHITATLSPSTVLSNYDITNDGAAFTISKATLSVNAVANFKTYGDADPSLGFDLTGFKFSENISAVTGTAACSRTTGETVLGSPYTITCAPGGLTAANYNFVTGSTANFSITPKALTATVTANNKVFDGNNTATLTGCSFNNLVAGDVVTCSIVGASATFANTMPGAWTVTATLLTHSGPAANNYSFNGTGNGTASIISWSLNGFYQPVGIPNTYSVPNPSPIVWNTVKGGQTVPLKFNILAGAVEQANVGAVQSFTATEVPCNIAPSYAEDTVEVTTTGSTTLRYSGTPGVDGQFIQNWQTPKAPDKCYRVIMRALDGSYLMSFFKTKK